MSGSGPETQAAAVHIREDGTLHMHNASTHAWPALLSCLSSRCSRLALATKSFGGASMGLLHSCPSALL